MEPAGPLAKGQPVHRPTAICCLDDLTPTVTVHDVLRLLTSLPISGRARRQGLSPAPSPLYPGPLSQGGMAPRLACLRCQLNIALPSNRPARNSPGRRSGFRMGARDWEKKRDQRVSQPPVACSGLWPWSLPNRSRQKISWFCPPDASEARSYFAAFYDPTGAARWLSPKKVDSGRSMVLGGMQPRSSRGPPNSSHSSPELQFGRRI
ncbi:hypothetical protein M432DRAFT_246639 [Thermoascus aurantiacus ATCC 26904]